MSIFYDFIFIIVALIHLPLYLFRGKFRRGFSRRLGFLPKGLDLDRPIWVHAVSVGEAITLKPLVESLRINYPQKRLVISTVTSTGNKIARQMARDTDLVTYLPFDISFIIRSVINRINPSLFIIAETELWPNLISSLYKNNIPVIVVNGRISDGSFRGYSKIRFLLKPMLDKVALFCVQTERDSQRLISLGAPQGKIRICGNMKFDASVNTNVSTVDLEEYRKLLGLNPAERLLVCGSTHPGEEEIVLNAYQDLQKEFPSLKLLIAPRHPERAKDIEKLILARGFNAVSISNPKLITYNSQTTTVFILDTIGQLIYFYALADIVFVGGSLIKKGGHNILEPASLGKPIIFGPNMFNFRDITDLFLADNAAIMLSDESQLKLKIKELLQNPQQAAELGRRAKALIADDIGATARVMDLIRRGYALS